MLSKLKRGGKRAGAGRKPRQIFEPIDASVDEIARRLMRPRKEKRSV